MEELSDGLAVPDDESLPLDGDALLAPLPVLLLGALVSLPVVLPDVLVSLPVVEPLVAPELVSLPVVLPLAGLLLVLGELVPGELVLGELLELELSSAARKASGAANAAATATTRSFLSVMTLPLRLCAQDCASIGQQHSFRRRPVGQANVRQAARV